MILNGFQPESLRPTGLGILVLLSQRTLQQAHQLFGIFLGHPRWKLSSSVLILLDGAILRQKAVAIVRVVTGAGCLKDPVNYIHMLEATPDISKGAVIDIPDIEGRVSGIRDIDEHVTSRVDPSKHAIL